MKLAFLNGLRGLAALIVVIDHFAISFFPAATDGSVSINHGGFEPLIERTPAHILVSGNFAVCVFFILSAIVLSSSFFTTHTRRVVIAAAWKRYLRLAIPVVASVMLGFGLLSAHLFANHDAAALTGSNWLGMFWQFQPNFWQALYHGSIGIFVRGSSDYNTVLWTMKTELIGSFLVFVTLLTVGRWRYRPLVYVALAIALVKTYYLAFIFGVALSDIHHQRQSLQNALRPGVWIPLLLVSCVLASSPVGTLNGTLFAPLDHLLPIGLSLTTTTHLLGALGVVVAVLVAPPLQQLLTTKPLLYLGHISFGLYLTHLYVIGTLTSRLMAWLAPVAGYRLGFVLALLPSIACIWLVADGFTRLVDQPAIRLSGSFARGAQRLTAQAKTILEQRPVSAYYPYRRGQDHL